MLQLTRKLQSADNGLPVESLLLLFNTFSCRPRSVGDAGWKDKAGALCVGLGPSPAPAPSSPRCT